MKIKFVWCLEKEDSGASTVSKKNSERTFSRSFSFKVFQFFLVTIRKLIRRWIFDNDKEWLWEIQLLENVRASPCELDTFIPRIYFIG